MSCAEYKIIEIRKSPFCLGGRSRLESWIEDPWWSAEGGCRRISDLVDFEDRPIECIERRWSVVDGEAENILFSVDAGFFIGVGNDIISTSNPRYSFSDGGFDRV